MLGSGPRAVQYDLVMLYRRYSTLGALSPFPAWYRLLLCALSFHRQTHLTKDVLSTQVKGSLTSYCCELRQFSSQ